jgi:hypothetical protein
MFKDWKWGDTWQTLGLLAVIAAATLGVALIYSPKNVDYYYVSSTSGDGGAGFCVWAHWTWHNDERAFCSDDKDRVLDFTSRANLTLAQNHR